MRGSIFFCSIFSVWRKLLLLPDYQPSKTTVLGMWLPNLSPTFTLSIYVGETQTPPAVTGSLKWSRPWKVPESPLSGLECMGHAFGYLVRAELLDLISLEDTSSAVIISSPGLLIITFS